MAYANVPEAPEGKVMAINREALLEAAHSNAEVMRERRAESQIQKNQRTKRADTVLGDAVTAAQDAMDAKSMEHLSVEELADKVVRRMAKVALMGGRAFTPVTLREVTDAASAWEAIAFKEAQRRKLASITLDDDEQTPVQQAAAAVKQLKKKMRDAGIAS